MNEIKGFFDEYAKFVDDVTSEIGKKDELFMERAAEISRWLDGNFSRMDNAVAGLAGEAGEIGDLWKKLKFHNKELSEENRQKLVDELSDVCWYAMQAAIALAREAAADGEVPVGAVVTRNGEIVSVGRNRREKDKNALAHAEIEAIDRACKALGGWRLWECELFVTLEPCPMCAGAILNARIPRVYYGARDRAMGACGGVLNLYMEPFALTPALVGGILADECRAVLESFFRGIRADKLP